MFRNRVDAGRALAAALRRYASEQPIILALPRGGVPVAAEIAVALGAPLDLILVRKIGVPMQPELAMGAVAEGEPPLIVRNEEVIAMADIAESEFQEVCDGEISELERRRMRYLGERKPLDLRERTAIIVDDGIATGATMRAALRAVRARNPKKLVLAVPVGPPDTLAKMRLEADEVIYLQSPTFFGSIGSYYADFRQVSDQEVVDTLARFSSAGQEEQIENDVRRPN
jgi:putative phosphoribosyl transferase